MLLSRVTDTLSDGLDEIMPGSSVVICATVMVGKRWPMRWMISLLTTVPRLWPMKCSGDWNRLPPVCLSRPTSAANRASAAASEKPLSLMSDSLFQSEISTTALPAVSAALPLWPVSWSTHWPVFLLYSSSTPPPEASRMSRPMALNASGALYGPSPTEMPGWKPCVRMVTPLYSGAAMLLIGSASKLPMSRNTLPLALSSTPQ